MITITYQDYFGEIEKDNKLIIEHLFTYSNGYWDLLKNLKKQQEEFQIIKTKWMKQKSTNPIMVRIEQITMRINFQILSISMNLVLILQENLPNMVMVIEREL